VVRRTRAKTSAAIRLVRPASCAEAAKRGCTGPQAGTGLLAFQSVPRARKGAGSAARLPELAGAALAADGAGAAAVGAGFLAGAPVLPVQACPVALRAGDAGAHRTLPEAPRPTAFVMGCPPYARGS